MICGLSGLHKGGGPSGLETQFLHRRPFLLGLEFSDRTLYFAIFDELIVPLFGVVTFIAESTQLCHQAFASHGGNRSGVFA